MVISTFQYTPTLKRRSRWRATTQMMDTQCSVLLSAKAQTMPVAPNSMLLAIPLDQTQDITQGLSKLLKMNTVQMKKYLFTCSLFGTKAW